MLEFWLINTDPWHVPDEDSTLVEVLRNKNGIQRINGQPRPNPIGNAKPWSPESLQYSKGYGNYWFVLENPPNPLDCTICRVG